MNLTITGTMNWCCVFNESRKFHVSLHRQYVEGLDSDRETLDYLMSDHLRMGGMYWGLGVLDILGCLPRYSKMKNLIDPSDPLSPNRTTVVNKDEVLQWISNCRDPITGGYGSNIGHDAHITSSLVNSC